MTKVHETLLARLQGADKIDWSRVVVDSSSIRAVHGGKNGSQSHRSRAKGEQAPPRDRRERHSARGHADWRQRTRRYPADPAGGCDTGRAWQAGKTAPQAGASSGRPGVRLQASLSHAPRARHQSRHCEAEHRAWQRLGDYSLGRRTPRELAPPTAKTSGTGRTTRRHPRGLHGFGMHHREQLLPLKPISLEALSPDGTRLATGARDATISLWDAVTVRSLGHLRSTGKAIIALTFSPDGTRLVTASRDSTQLWGVSNSDLYRASGSQLTLLNSVSKTKLRHGFRVDLRLRYLS